MKIFRLCGPYLKKHSKKIFLFALYGIGIQLLSLVTPYITGHFIDGLLTENTMAFAYRFCSMLAAVVLVRLVIQYMQNMSYVKLQLRMGFELNRDIIFHVQDLPLSFLNNRDISRLNSQINGDANDLVIFCLGIFNAFILHLVALPALMILCFHINMKITAYYLIYCVLYLIVYHAVRRHRYKVARKLYDSQNSYFSFLHEQLAYINYIKNNGVSGFFRKRLEKPFENLAVSSRNNQRFEVLFATIDDALSLFADITLYLVGAHQIFNSNFTVGNFIIFSAYFAMVKQSITYFYNFGSTYQQALVRHDRTKLLLDEEPEPEGSLDPGKISRIEFHNLHFGYADKTIIDHFNYQLHSGQIYAIVGHNGTGKTTLAKILLGLYNSEINKNSVTINGEFDILEIRKQLLRHEKVAYVEQSPILINADVLSNIVLDRNRSEPLISKIRELSKVLNMDEIIFGDDENSQDINSLSGGEQQKIAIIRALTKDADVYVFDEPTAALDADSSKIVLDILQELKKDKIIILISHEDAVISACDVLISYSEWSADTCHPTPADGLV